MAKTLKNTVLFIAFVSMLAVPALSADRTRVSPAWNLFSTQQDIEMGRVLADEAERTMQVVDDHNANTYIDALGKQLTAHAPGTRYPYQFKIVSDDSINAWALPGGVIYVTTGLIEAAQTEPELAGFLAHEIAHVALRHGTAEVSQAYSNRVSNGARGRVGVDDAMQRLNIRFESNAIPLKYTREEERQADLIGAQILYDTGFDPQAMPQFLNRIADDRYNRRSDWLDGHPNLSNRTALVRTEVRNLGGLRANVRGDSGDFHSVRDRLPAANTNNWPSTSNRDRVYGDRPDLPSTRTVLYQGRDIEFRYPSNWRVSEDGDSISIAPDLGIVSGSMAYGMTVGMFDPGDNRYRNSFSNYGSRIDPTTLSRATDQLIDHLQQPNPGMRVVRNSERRRVDGQQAMVIELSNESPLGGYETNWLVTVLRPNGLLRYFVGVAPQQEFSQYRSAFDQIVSSARFLD
jgi:beta-barrel assembly-enhancing protease